MAQFIIIKTKIKELSPCIYKWQTQRDIEGVVNDYYICLVNVSQNAEFVYRELHI